MYGLFDDPGPIPVNYWRDVHPIAPVRPIPRPTRTWNPRISLVGEFADELQARELWRMHKAPYLYPRWYRDLTDDLHTQVVNALGKASFDCDTCRITVIVSAITDPCPRCGQQ